MNHIFTFLCHSFYIWCLRFNNHLGNILFNWGRHSRDALLTNWFLKISENFIVFLEPADPATLSISTMQSHVNVLYPRASKWDSGFNSSYDLQLCREVASSILFTFACLIDYMITVCNILQCTISETFPLIDIFDLFGFHASKKLVCWHQLDGYINIDKVLLNHSVVHIRGW